MNAQLYKRTSELPPEARKAISRLVRLARLVLNQVRTCDKQFRAVYMVQARGYLHGASVVREAFGGKLSSGGASQVVWLARRRREEAA